MIRLNDSLSTSTQERVSVLDANTLEVLFQAASPMRVSVKESKRAKSLPLRMARNDQIMLFVS
ncbi:phage protein [Bordetella avium]|nr:phage protein [Bordetella avium]